MLQLVARADMETGTLTQRFHQVRVFASAWAAFARETQRFPAFSHCIVY